MITELGRGTRFRDRREGLRMALEALVATYARQHTSQVDWIGGTPRRRCACRHRPPTEAISADPEED